MRPWVAGLAGLMCVLAATVGAQQSVPIERILLLVNDDFVTALDVRQAKLLKLVDGSSASDLDVAKRLAERRLELAEVARILPKEPSPQAIDARRHQWEASLAGSDLPTLLREAGMPDADLTAWLRDDVRIETYVDQAFGATVAPTRSEMLQYYQQHVSDYTRGGVARPFDEVSAEVKQTMQDHNRIEFVKAWAASLVRQADVRLPR